MYPLGLLIFLTFSIICGFMSVLFPLEHLF